MNDLEKLRQWLLTFPMWDGGGYLFVDFTDNLPGSMGLYPAGLEICSKEADVAGNVTLRCRYNFALYRVGGVSGEGQDALWLLQLQKWVMEQSVLGLAPVFGDEPAAERITAQKGKLKEPAKDGCGVYSVILTAEFVRRF